MDVSIGELARISGVPVKTIRYYSDIGLVPEAERTAGGYRRYDDEGMGRLELVRALRDLGVDIPAIRAVLDRAAGISAVAAAQADAVDVHIRRLTMRRAVLRALARSGSTPQEVQRMTDFARASAGEARRIMEEFLEAVFTGSRDDPFAARMAAALPELPDEPSAAQVDAWVELAALVSDDGFRARVAGMVADGARRRAAGDGAEADEAAQRNAAAVLEQAGAALRQGIAPASGPAAPIVGGLAALYASAAGRSDDASFRHELADRLAAFTDARVERYWELIGLINGWSARLSSVAPFQWFIDGLRAAP